MFILLPPSEGKATAHRGAPLDLDQLSLPALRHAREKVLDDLVKLSADQAQALAVLGLSPGQTADAERNVRLREAAAMPAAKVYTGVLYDALDLAGLPVPARRRARRQVLVFSGLWGVVGLADRIPAYRCSIGVRLPNVGPLTAHWKAALARPLGELTGEGLTGEGLTGGGLAGGGFAGSELVLDLRSSAYAAMWTPRNAVTVRVLHERQVDGQLQRSVVSHFNKATKGRLVRELLLSAARPKTPARLAGVLRDLGYRVESTTPTQLDVIVDTLPVNRSVVLPVSRSAGQPVNACSSHSE